MDTSKIVYWVNDPDVVCPPSSSFSPPFCSLVWLELWVTTCWKAVQGSILTLLLCGHAFPGDVHTVSVWWYLERLLRELCRLNIVQHMTTKHFVYEQVCNRPNTHLHLMATLSLHEASAISSMCWMHVLLFSTLWSHSGCRYHNGMVLWWPQPYNIIHIFYVCW